mgnify:CR=1 FL=1
MTGEAMVAMIRSWIAVEINSIVSMLYMVHAMVWNPMSMQELISWFITGLVGITVVMYNMVNIVKAIYHWNKPPGERPTKPLSITGFLKKKKKS